MLTDKLHYGCSHFGWELKLVSLRFWQTVNKIKHWLQGLFPVLLIIILYSFKYF